MAGPSGLLAILAKPKGKASVAEEEEEAPASEREQEGEEDAEFNDAFDTFWDAVESKDKDTAREAFKTAMAACMAMSDMHGEDY